MEFSRPKVVVLIENGETVPYGPSKTSQFVRVLKGQLVVRTYTGQWTLNQDSVLLLSQGDRIRTCYGSGIGIQFLVEPSVTGSNWVPITRLCPRDFRFDQTHSHIVANLVSRGQLLNHEVHIQTLQPKDIEYFQNETDRILNHPEYFLDRYSIHQSVISAQQSILSNLRQCPSLSALGAKEGFSEFHFLRQFKSAFGISPYQYLLQERVRRACRLLIQSELPIDSVAEMSGFDSLSSMYAHFKRITSKTPAAFREAKKSLRAEVLKLAIS